MDGEEDGDTAIVPAENDVEATNLARARAIKAAKKKTKSMRRRAPMKYWTQKEERALMTAMESVGPWWKTIIECFGEGGTVDESLKGRSNPALRKKAAQIKRNMIREGKPVPAYMKDVAIDRDSRSRFKIIDAEDSEDEYEPASPVAKRLRQSIRDKDDGTATCDTVDSGGEAIEQESDDEDMKIESKSPQRTSEQPHIGHQVDLTPYEANAGEIRMMELQLRVARAEEKAAQVELELFKLKRLRSERQ